MKNMVGINFTEWGLDLQDPPSPPLHHQASSPCAIASDTKEPKSCLVTLQMPNSILKFLQKVLHQGAILLSPPALHCSLVGLSRRYSWKAEERKVFHWEFGNWEILLLPFLGSLLLVFRGKYNYLKRNL